jgi:hypothetical protein
VVEGASAIPSYIVWPPRHPVMATAWRILPGGREFCLYPLLVATHNTLVVLTCHSWRVGE